MGEGRKGKLGILKALGSCAGDSRSRVVVQSSQVQAFSPGTDCDLRSRRKNLGLTLVLSLCSR